jgi:hypothetical protein
MKRILTAAVATISLSGCVAYAPYTPYYVQPAPVYVQPRPVYVAPPVYYRPPPPRCYWVQRWDPQYRTTRNMRVCR